MVATADILNVTEEGMFNDVPVKASTKIYQGAMVGLTSGYARGLVAGDRFVGHAYEQADNSAVATDGYINCKVRSGKYRLKVTISSVAVTDVGKEVYGSADNTYTLTKSTNTLVGRVVRYVTTDTCVVEFDAASGGSDVVDHNHTAQATDGGPLTSPRIVTAINDTNGCKVIGIGVTSLADNRISVTNNVGTTAPVVAAAGTSTNIGLGLAAKGSGTIEVASPITIAEDKDIVLGTSVGTMIGTASTQKLGLYGVAPVARQAHIADPTSSTAPSLRTAILSILSRLETLGILKTS